MSATTIETSAFADSYLTDGFTIRSWLLTTDHKRIALLYLGSITMFFFIGGIAAALTFTWRQRRAWELFMNLLRQARRGLAAAVFLGLWLCGQTCQAQVIFKELEDVPAPIGRDTVQTIEGQVAMPARAVGAVSPLLRGRQHPRPQSHCRCFCIGND